MRTRQSSGRGKRGGRSVSNTVPSRSSPRRGVKEKEKTKQKKRPAAPVRDTRKPKRTKKEVSKSEDDDIDVLPTEEEKILAIVGRRMCNAIPTLSPLQRRRAALESQKARKVRGTLEFWSDDPVFACLYRVVFQEEVEHLTREGKCASVTVTYKGSEMKKFGRLDRVMSRVLTPFGFSDASVTIDPHVRMVYMRTDDPHPLSEVIRVLFRCSM